MPLFGPPNVEKLKRNHDVKGLIKALDYEKDKQVRLDAATALGVIGDPEAVKPLISAIIAEKVKGGESRAVDALEKIGAPSVEPLIAALKDFPPDTLVDIVKALGKIKDPRAIQPLISLLNNNQAIVRLYALRSLITFKDPIIIDPLISALKDSYYTVRKEAVAALGELKDPKAVEPLCAVLNDPEEEVRKEAARALAKIPDPRAVKPLCLSLSDKEIFVAGKAADALVEIGESSKESLVAVLSSTNGNARKEAAKALDKLGWKPNDDEAGAAYWIVHRNWDKVISMGAPAIESLITAFQTGGDRDGELIDVLGKMADTRAVKPLISILIRSFREWHNCVEKSREELSRNGKSVKWEALSDNATGESHFCSFIFATLMKIGDPNFLDKLEAEFVNKDTDFHLFGMYIQGQFNSKNLYSLNGILDQEDPKLRQYTEIVIENILNMGE
jgi:HEAT repeat protein